MSDSSSDSDSRQNTSDANAFVAPAARGAVEVTGDDRLEYLDDVLTQRLRGREVGEVAATLYLDAKGRPLAMADVAVLDERIVLLTPDGEVARDLADTLGSRTFLADAAFHALDVAACALRGDDGRRVAADAGFDVAPGAVADRNGVLVVGRSAGIDAVGPADAIDAVAERLRDAGAAAAGRDDLEAWRIAHGVPAWAREIRPPHLPEEAGVLPTHVHLDKGCYPGQEAVARMWMLGRPRRRLARVHLGGDAKEGWTSGSGRSAVEVTSAATYEGQRVGLAYVPADAEPGQRFGDDSGEVVVRDLVGADMDVPGHDPSVTRRRDRRA